MRRRASLQSQQVGSSACLSPLLRFAERAGLLAASRSLAARPQGAALTVTPAWRPTPVPTSRLLCPWRPDGESCLWPHRPVLSFFTVFSDSLPLFLRA